MRPTLFIPLIFALPMAAAAQDTFIAPTVVDSPLQPKATMDTAAHLQDKAARVQDSVVPASKSTTPAQTPVSAAPAKIAIAPPAEAVDSFSVFSDYYVAIGVGLSLGSLPPLKNWKTGLPKTLSDAGLPGTTVGDNGDTVSLLFTVQETPDDYNMMFPVSVSIGRLMENRRFSTAVAFSILSKKWNAALNVDSLHSVTISERMRFLSFLMAADYGIRIPEHYFSVDNVDRTDVIIGIAASPLIALKRSYSVSPSSSDPLLASVADTLSAHWNGFDASGVAIAWRFGITTLRRASPRGGVEAGLSYQGSWNTRFKDHDRPLTAGDINRKCDRPDTPVSWFSNRFDITISLVRRTF
jgi:hypothetical protein